MTVEITSARLAANYGEILGIRRAFEYIPRVIQIAELPAVVIFPGGVVDVNDDDEMVIEVRDYIGMLLISPVGMGTETQGQILTEPLFDRVRDYFIQRHGLELDTPQETPQIVVFNASFEGDDGFQILQYPLNGTPYAGIQFRHRITEYADITYKD